MISRNSALAVADTYSNAFFYTYQSGLSYERKTKYCVDTDKLYDYLFINNYPAWFCNLSKKTFDTSERKNYATRKLKEFIMKLHTGETQFEATNNWTWKQREQLGQEYLVNLANDVLNKWHKEWKLAPEYGRLKIQSAIDHLEKCLELDGYIYSESRLLASESDVLDTQEESGVLESLYKSLVLENSETAFHHLKLSEEHYINSRWDDSIANSRKFLECVLKEVASLHSKRINNIILPDKIADKPVQVREYLEKEGLLEAKELLALSSVYGLLSETGSHPYMAQNDQARLLRHLSLTFSQFALLRLQGKLTKP